MPEKKVEQPDKPDVQEAPPTQVAEETPPEAARVEKLHLPDGTEITAEDIAQLKRDVAASKAQLKDERIDKITKAGLDRGVPPVVVNAVSALLNELDMDSEYKVTLETTDGPKDFNLFNAVAHILEVVPGRLGEITQTPAGQQPPAKQKSTNPYEGNDEDMTLEEAEALARKRRRELKLSRGEVEL